MGSEPPIRSFRLRNARGFEVRGISLGGILTAILAPDRAGRFADVVLGFDRDEGYRGEHPYFGAIVGRYANRIAGGRFDLDGRTYELATNDGPNHLHGGARGFDSRPWELRELAAGAAVELSRVSPAGEEGYPGTLEVHVTYTITDANELVVDYDGAADAPTPVNLTQHSYFNLAAGGDVLDHELTLMASRFTRVDETSIPTGELASVEGTPFDFREPRRIGDRIAADHPQLAPAGGYDHNWVLDGGPGLRAAAHVHEPSSGRTLTVATDQPGVQFYAGNLLDGSVVGKGGRAYRRHAGLCLETQHFPDSPNQPAFPSTILRPGTRFRSRTVFTFGWR